MAQPADISQQSLSEVINACFEKKFKELEENLKVVIRQELANTQGRKYHQNAEKKKEFHHSERIDPFVFAMMKNKNNAPYLVSQAPYESFLKMFPKQELFIRALEYHRLDYFKRLIDDGYELNDTILCQFVTYNNTLRNHPRAKDLYGEWGVLSTFIFEKFNSNKTQSIMNLMKCLITQMLTTLVFNSNNILIKWIAKNVTSEVIKKYNLGDIMTSYSGYLISALCKVENSDDEIRELFKIAMENHFLTKENIKFILNQPINPCLVNLLREHHLLPKNYKSK